MRVRVPVSTANNPASPASVAAGSQPEATEPAPVAVPIGSSPAPATAVATAGANASGGMKLELHATDECWVRVTADGKRALSRVMKPGDTETLEVQDGMVLEIGNAGGLAFSINGRPGKPLGEPGRVRNITITKDTLSAFLQ